MGCGRLNDFALPGLFGKASIRKRRFVPANLAWPFPRNENIYQEIILIILKKLVKV